jgi:hypothetical protein
VARGTVGSSWIVIYYQENMKHPKQGEKPVVLVFDPQMCNNPRVWKINDIAGSGFIAKAV